MSKARLPQLNRELFPVPARLAALSITAAIFAASAGAPSANACSCVVSPSGQLEVRESTLLLDVSPTNNLGQGHLNTFVVSPDPPTQRGFQLLLVLPKEFTLSGAQTIIAPTPKPGAQPQANSGSEASHAASKVASRLRNPESTEPVTSANGGGQASTLRTLEEIRSPAQIKSLQNSFKIAPGLLKDPNLRFWKASFKSDPNGLSNVNVNKVDLNFKVSKTAQASKGQLPKFPIRFKSSVEPSTDLVLVAPHRVQMSGYSTTLALPATEAFGLKGWRPNLLGSKFVTKLIKSSQPAKNSLNTSTLTYAAADIRFVASDMFTSESISGFGTGPEPELIDVDATPQAAIQAAKQPGKAAWLLLVLPVAAGLLAATAIQRRRLGRENS